MVFVFVFFFFFSKRCFRKKLSLTSFTLSYIYLTNWEKNSKILKMML